MLTFLSLRGDVTNPYQINNIEKNIFQKGFVENLQKITLT